MPLKPNQTIAMTFPDIKTAFQSIYRAACINGDVTPVQTRNLEQLKSDLSDHQNEALTMGDNARWTEAFELTQEIDTLLGVDYGAESVLQFETA